MTRGIAETRRRLVEWPLKYDAHTWPRSADRRTLRPTGRGEYGYNRVQEIVSGTIPRLRHIWKPKRTSHRESLGYT